MATWAVISAFMSPAQAQPDVGEGPLLAYESVSVLPSHPANGPILSVSDQTGALSARGVSLKRLVAFAYDVDPSRVVGGPAWVDSSYYEIEASGPAGTLGGDALSFVDQAREMLKGVLFDHFGLVAHKEQASLGPSARSAPIEQLVIDQVHELPPELGRGRVFEPLRE